MKAIIPSSGLGARFLPLSQAIPKELLPLADLPMVHYVAKEAADSKIEQVVFILSEDKKVILDYFKKSPKLESLLESRGEKELLQRIKEVHKDFEGLSFSSVIQSKPKGDGDAILRARQQMGKNSFAVMFPDDIFKAKKPPTNQLLKVFKTSQKPVIGLKKLDDKEKLSSHSVAKVEKIASRLYKIKEIVDSPKAEEAPSDLAISGRFVLPNEVFSYLAKVKPNKEGQILLADAFNLMLADGKMIYGYEMEAQSLGCGETIDWLKSNLSITLEHPEYGPALKEYLKKLI